MRLLRSEWYRMLYSKIHWGITVVLLLLSFWMLDSGYLARASGREVMLLLWQNPMPLMWSGVVLAVGSIGSSFQERNWNGAIYKGHPRVLLLFTRACSYYLWGLLIHLAAMAAVLTRYQAWGEVFGMGAEVLLPRVLLHMLLVMALLTPPLLISFLLRDVFGSMALSSGLTFLMQNLLGQGGESLLERLAERFYPAAGMLDLNLWVNMDGAAVQRLVVLCGGYLVAGVLVSAGVFWAGEMK